MRNCSKKWLWLATLALAGVSSARADLIGTTVTGDLNFGYLLTNFYDPAIGYVPSTGYQNSSSNQDSTTVTIVGGDEFGYQDEDDTDVTTFSSTGFTFTITAIPS